MRFRKPRESAQRHVNQLRLYKRRLRYAINTHVNHACPDFADIVFARLESPKCRCRTTKAYIRLVNNTRRVRNVR